MFSSSYIPKGPVTLTEAQILALHADLRKMRHDVNGRLANIIAAAERLKLLLEQPMKASESITEFSQQFETQLGLLKA